MADSSGTDSYPSSWKKAPFIKNSFVRWLLIVGGAIYLAAINDPEWKEISYYINNADISQINGFVANAEQIYDSMAQDKKVLNGVIRFILASDIGKAMVQENIDKALVLEVLQQSLER